ncbi:hypothetical protein HETIRDRAFT_432307 [Heterobasidion irregulare TC 32-1]|uniref:Uncharacterized protein n=1 Tax=Heterobasidion irregulare (strain TC 32-1) TaxID=747525 RepID=W4KIU2_HETIT|nr:uncharacterized protein HETIRDRAFT_432307 [Heterobasidion irregulare TC 32-1]ETW85629.1 hypothetical protein HETIRDRAFT_432307 [Heterobasidion irregulare TC 32-1]
MERSRRSYFIKSCERARHASAVHLGGDWEGSLDWGGERRCKVRARGPPRVEKTARTRATPSDFQPPRHVFPHRFVSRLSALRHLSDISASPLLRPLSPLSPLCRPLPPRSEALLFIPLSGIDACDTCSPPA